MSEAISFEDWQAICNAKAQYCRFLDSKQWDAFASLFTEDYELDVSDGTDKDIIKGRDTALKMVQESLTGAKTAHQVHLPEMTRDGDDILVIWAMQDRVIWSEEMALTGYGTYHERWVKQGGAWKIAYLKLARYIVEM
ncbi:nuclear transport factor 2 family protein [Haliea sp. E17]|uniref:nuclear transport factor 2 family protein n=1 Tax=Haliea sp. E17 TaxID=3401576 RepID=UPI003AAC38C3